MAQRHTYCHGVDTLNSETQEVTNDSCLYYTYFVAIVFFHFNFYKCMKNPGDFRFISNVTLLASFVVSSFIFCYFDKLHGIDHISKDSILLSNEDLII